MSLIKAIPSLLTISNLLCGVLAIILADPQWSSLLILIAGIFDLLDGAAAKALNAQSEMGKELDSLCDMVSFGVAPAYLYYLLAPSGEAWFLIVPLSFAAFAALRLARFNTLEASKDFIGLATPSAALALTGLVLGYHYGQPLITSLVSNNIAFLLTGVLIAISMIIPLPMFSFKGLGDPSDRIFIIVLLICVVVITIIDWRLTLPLAILTYIILSVVRLLALDRS